MKILTLDPGTTKTAWMKFDTVEFRPTSFGWIENDDVKEWYCTEYLDRIICEGIQSYGMPVGKETFETCIWMGRFQERALQTHRVPFEIMYRSQAKLQLCQSSRAKDPNVRQALLDRFPATGGGKIPQIGTKNDRGPLYGVSNHIWSALAIAVAWIEIEAERRLK